MIEQLQSGVSKKGKKGKGKGKPAAVVPVRGKVDPRVQADTGVKLEVKAEVKTEPAVPSAAGGSRSAIAVKNAARPTLVCCA